MAIERVQSINPSNYAKSRNAIDGAVSRLSPYITHGLISLEEVLQELIKKYPLDMQHKFVYELGWREFFRHVWHHQGQGILSSLHKGVLPDSAYSDHLPEDILEACTGVPVIDRSVTELYESGYLHNHARMWLASYVVHIRKVHWRVGADWLYSHLLDGDLASNHLSWQWVSGTGSSKPYLFNAENVARFAPTSWHSFNSVIDQSYEALDQIARTDHPYFKKVTIHKGTERVTEPVKSSVAPNSLHFTRPDASLVKDKKIRLIHPWSLGEWQLEEGKDTLTVGVLFSEFHKAWPWSEKRWSFVYSRMTELTQHIWYADTPELRQCLSGAVLVTAQSDPHIRSWLSQVAKLDEPASLFPAVQKPCTSFSQWWNKASKGLRSAIDILPALKSRDSFFKTAMSRREDVPC
jgi:deoxyribodipyrimidine photo-lyase